MSTGLPSLDPPLSANSSSKSPTHEKRVALACLRCRAKRARCSGHRPSCRTCVKANEECTWPTGRRRKRTRTEMQEEDRQEREVAANAGRLGTFLAWESHPYSPMPWAPPASTAEYNSEDFWDLPESPQQTWGSVINGVIDPAIISPTAGPTLLHAHANVGGWPARRLTAHVAPIEPDPVLQEDLELYYYRISGSTAIHPGVNRISLKLQPHLSSDGPLSKLTSQAPGFQSMNMTHQRSEDPFNENSLPHPDIYIPLLDIFFHTMSRLFPSVNRQRIEERLETRTMSVFLLNCICALGARFHPSAQDNPHKASAPFITKAQELITPLLHLPSTEVVTGLLLLAWANYGQNSESGLWQYSGMAIRMALDLGIHANSGIHESHAHLVRARLLFWSIFVTDRILAFSTGRPPSISEELIEIPLPTDRDFIPEGMRFDPGAYTGPPQPTPFVYIVQLMVLCGRIGNAFNGRRGQSRTLATGPDPSASLEALRQLQADLVHFCAELPDGIKWSVDALKMQEARGHADSFLALHLWANSVMAIMFHPELMANPSSIETPLSQDFNRSIKLSFSNSRILTECLVCADTFASRSYLANPFAVHPLYVACLAFIHDIRVHETEVMENRSPSSPSRQNLSILTKALQRMEHYWAGVSHVLNTLEERVTGLGCQHVNMSKVKKTFITLPDNGLLHRFMGRNLLHETLPAADATLHGAPMGREAAAARETEDPCSLGLDDLFTTFTIESLYTHSLDIKEPESGSYEAMSESETST